MASVPLEVFEPATSDNLFPTGYLLANRDLQKAFGCSTEKAMTHFFKHGHGKNRLQITAHFLKNVERHRDEKLELFRDAPLEKSITNLPAVTHKIFSHRHATRANRAPLHVGDLSPNGWLLLPPPAGNLSVVSTFHVCREIKKAGVLPMVLLLPNY
jgi:hypothetical protein